MILQQLEKNYLKTQQCQLGGRISYKTIAKSTYTVSLAWLHCRTREPQWLQYFKLVFLEIQNMPLRTVFANPVTYIDTHAAIKFRVTNLNCYTVASYVAMYYASYMLNL